MNTKDNTQTELLALAVECVVVVAALLFFIGISYGRAYYGSLGIGFPQLEFEATTIMTWAAYLIRENYFDFVVIPILIILALPISQWLAVLLTLIIKNDSWKSVTNRIIKVTVFAVWILFLFGLSANYLHKEAEKIANKDAFRDINAGTTLLPKVKMIFKEPDWSSGLLEELRVEKIFKQNGYWYVGIHKGIHYFLTLKTASGEGDLILFSVPGEVVGALVHSIQIKKG